MDDLLITGIKSKINKINKLYIKKRKKKFKISKCNKVDYLLGIKIEKNNFNYIILQTQLINDIFTKIQINIYLENQNHHVQE